jgi:hypothetical protein
MPVNASVLAFVLEGGRGAKPEGSAGKGAKSSSASSAHRDSASLHIYKHINRYSSTELKSRSGPRHSINNTPLIS